MKGKDILELLFLQALDQDESSFYMTEDGHDDQLARDCMLLNFGRGSRKHSKNLHQVEKFIKTGSTKTNWVGDFGSFQILHDKDAITNILAFHSS